MKKYSKQLIPESYKKWFDENKERLQAKPIDETQLFEAITPKLKRALNNQLLKEQGSICAYCGKRIGKNPDTLSIDRFPNPLKCIFSIQPNMIVSIILNMSRMAR